MGALRPLGFFLDTRFAEKRLRVRASPSGSGSLNVLLAAVDVVGRARHRRVRHQVDGERRDILRAHDAADGVGGSELLAPGVEIVAEQGRRQRRVDESRGDQVDADGGELKGEAPRQSGRASCRERVSSVV